jgi:hypothetical protein
MSLAYVDLVLDLYDGSGNYPVSGTASFVPSSVLDDPGVEVTGQMPVTTSFRAGSLPAVSLLATDNPGPLPAGWTWGITFAGITGAPAAFSFFLPAGPAAFTATDAAPAVFTWTPPGSEPWQLQSLPDGTGVQLSGASLPGGFSAGTTYYVVNASGYVCGLAATQGGTPIASTSSGSGELTVVSQLMSNLIQVSSGSTFQAYMPLSGGQFTGAVAGAVVSVADGATIEIDAALGSTFRVTLGGNHELTVVNPGFDSQKIVVEVTQGEGGPWTLTYSSAFDFGAAGEPVLSTATGDEDDFGLSYKAATGKWKCLAFVAGY